MKSPAFYAILLSYVRLASVLFSLGVSAYTVHTQQDTTHWKKNATLALSFWAVLGECIMIVPSLLPRWLNNYPSCGITMSTKPSPLDLLAAPWKVKWYRRI